MDSQKKTNYTKLENKDCRNDWIIMNVAPHLQLSGGNHDPTVVPNNMKSTEVMGVISDNEQVFETCDIMPN
jgi:hypothetical protein